jgi:hypothetical protein
MWLRRTDFLAARRLTPRAALHLEQDICSKAWLFFLIGIRRNTIARHHQAKVPHEASFAVNSTQLLASMPVRMTGVQAARSRRAAHSTQHVA